MSVSRRLRYEILRRDAHACRYCGAAAPDVALTVDHVLPVALGGSDDASNLVTACKDCNAGKAASNPDAELVANIDADALRWAAAVQRAAEVQKDQHNCGVDYAHAFLAAWVPHWTPEAQEATVTMRLPDTWEASVVRFHELGIESELMTAAVSKAMAVNHVPDKQLFNYFCGICWNIHRERQEIARQVFEADR